MEPAFQIIIAMPPRSKAFKIIKFSLIVLLITLTAYSIGATIYYFRSHAKQPEAMSKQMEILGLQSAACLLYLFGVLATVLEHFELVVGYATLSAIFVVTIIVVPGIIVSAATYHTLSALLIAYLFAFCIRRENSTWEVFSSSS